MNTTLQHIAKPASKEKRQKTKLPPQAALFAKQMGLDLTGLEAEAEDIWNKLNELSEDKPLEYESFVKEQLDGAKESPQDGSKPETKYFRPKAGFCVRTRTTGGDGIKIRDENSGKKFFVNMCSFDAIEAPRDRSGRPAVDERMCADGLEFPLIVGPVRSWVTEAEEDSLAVDVVFHPAVLHHCALQQVFKKQVVDLALSWVKRETSVQFNAEDWTALKSPVYAGGRGADEATPVLMPVDHAMAQAAGPQQGGSGASSSATPKPALMSSPQNLLKFSEIERQEQQEITADKESVRISSSSSSVKKSPATLVQEIDSSGAVVESAPMEAIAPAPATRDTGPLLTEVKSKEKAKQSSSSSVPVVKKGFLNESAAKGKYQALYPEGSAEGAGGAKGGTYERFMSRCKVVDTSQMNAPASAQASHTLTAAPAAAKITEQPRRDTGSSRAAALSSTASSASVSNEGGAKKKKETDQSALSAEEMKNVDKLFAGIDSEWGESHAFVSRMREEELRSDQFSELARILGGGKPGALESGGQRNEDKGSNTQRANQTPALNIGRFQVLNSLPSNVEFDIREEQINSDEYRVVVLVKNLSLEQIQCADLKVSLSSIDLSFAESNVQLNRRLAISLQGSSNGLFDSTKTAAKTSKKKGTMEISCLLQKK